MAKCAHFWKQDYDEQVCVMCGRRLYPDPDCPEAALREAGIASQAMQEERRTYKKKGRLKFIREDVCLEHK